MGSSKKWGGPHVCPARGPGGTKSREASNELETMWRWGSGSGVVPAWLARCRWRSPLITPVELVEMKRLMRSAQATLGTAARYRFLTIESLLTLLPGQSVLDPPKPSELVTGRSLWRHGGCMEGLWRDYGGTMERERTGKGGVTGGNRRFSEGRMCKLFRHSPLPKLPLLYPSDLGLTNHIRVAARILRAPEPRLPARREGAA